MFTKVIRSLGASGWLPARAGRAGSFACESLESRQLMSTFAYADLAALVSTPDASGLADGYYGPVVALGDVDGDGTTDLLVGNQYSSVATGSSAPTVFNGAAVLSGATGAAIRRISPADSVRFGWSVAALGDVDGDGVPDYGIGTGGPEGDPVAYAFSGATGETLHTFGMHISGPPGVAGTTIAGAGDINGDGRADILVSFLADNRTVLYSGADGSELRVFDGEGTLALSGGEDLDNDGTPDIVAGTLTHLTAYSGATGAQLWRIAHPTPYPVQRVCIDGGTDFNSDGRADLLITTTDFHFDSDMGVVNTKARLHSGIDGSLLLTISGPGTDVLAGAAGAIGDRNGDGVPDIGATVRTSVIPEVGDIDGLYVYSGADGTLLSIIRDSGPATRTGASGPASGQHRMWISGSVTASDLDGDGLAEVIASAVYDTSGTTHDPATLRLISFDGATLGAPVFDHAGSDSAGNLIAWGHLGATPFIHNRGRTSFITDLGFGINDRIVSFTGFGSEVLLVVEANGDPGNPIAWYASADLTGGRAYPMNNAPRTGAIPHDFRMVRAVDADDGQVLLEMTYFAATKTIACIFERTPGGGAGDPGRIVFAMESLPIAIKSGRIVGLRIDDPSACVLWDLDETVSIQAFHPVGLWLLADDGSGHRPVVIVGLAEREGDDNPRPYTYTSSSGEFTALPLIEGGTEWNPIEVNSAGDVAGTFRRSTGETSLFLTRSVYLGDPSIQTFDVLASTLIGAPAGLTGAAPAVIGLGAPAQVYFTFGSPAAVGVGVLSDIAGPGPYLSPAGAAFSLSDDGNVLVTRNAAGELLMYTRGFTQGGVEEWSRQDLAYSPDETEALFDTPHFGDIVTWTDVGFTKPSIALSTGAGLILIEPVLVIVTPGLPPSVEEQYVVRDLTTEVAGSEPISGSLFVILPPNALRLVGGLAPDGDLILYGLNQPKDYNQFNPVATTWAYANFYDQVLRPTGLAEPRFDVASYGDLASYVTAWGGLNIAGVDTDSGDVVVFWTAPGLLGWQIANLDDAIAQPQPRTTPVSHLNVYLTSWGGINIVGGQSLGVLWWAPGMGSTWSFNELTGIAAGAQLRSDTITAYTTPWDGLNIAGLDAEGKLWVYWWTPTVYWTAQTIDAALSDSDASVPRTGRLRSAVSAEGRIDIYARSLLGDPLRYEWTPDAPWTLKNLNVL